MFTGTMIDELISSVERAERHAREVEILKMEFGKMELHEFSFPRMESQELMGVA